MDTELYKILHAVTPAIVERNYLEIKQDIRDIIEQEMEHLLCDPALAHLIISKK